ncbi:carotenoid biosynthesis protein, partial [Kouleothrix sp.]|uniref:carotenoid biosynthesis protein n=1 Tax=Kouleothrix sp. TaxID=2779161 RepID=UPI003918B0BE
MRLFRSLALGIFLLYLALLPGSMLVVALDRVPAWGDWMGGLLLLLQGAAVLSWLIGRYGRRGALAAVPVFLVAWGVEHLGVTTGFPFGRYEYTATLQPQFFGVVPLPIACAWLMVGFGAWQLAGGERGARAPGRTALVAATLVLALDLQIETVATRVNSYWVWFDSGPYYGVPTANFIAWWLVGLAIALAIQRSLPGRQVPALARRGWAGELTRIIPAALYLLNTLMFAVVNLARGYPLAGMLGVVTLLVLALWRAQLRLYLPPLVVHPDAS